MKGKWFGKSMGEMNRKNNKLWLILIYAVLAVGSFVAFSQVLGNDFINYDDDAYVTANPKVNNGFSSESVLWAFSTGHASNWHPLTWLSHMLDCELFGLRAGGHHLMSLLIHIGNTLLLFWVLRRMSGAVWASVFVAAAFAVHPLHVESVAWAAERKDVLSCFFALLTIAAYIRYAERRGVVRYLLVFFVFALGLMAKPMLVTLPFVLLLLDYWPLNRFAGSKLSELVNEKVPLFGLAVVSSFITFIVQHNYGAVTPMSNVSLKFRLTNAVVSYVSYLGKMIWPWDLAMLYPHPVGSEGGLVLIVSCAILVLITGGVIYMRRRRYLVVGWLWYVVTLVPVIGLVQVGNQGMADRYTYIPLTGIFIMLAWGAAELSGRYRWRRIAVTILAIVLLAGAGVRTWAQVKLWRNNLTLYEHTLSLTENNYKIHNNYGIALAKAGRIDEAIEQFGLALRIYPEYPEVHLNIGRAYLLEAKTTEAISHLKSALEAEPAMVEAYEYMGRAYARSGKYDLAIESYGRALEIRPEYSNVFFNMAEALTRQGKYDEAIGYLQKVILAELAWAGSYYSLANIYYRRGQMQLAVVNYYKTLELERSQLNVRLHSLERLVRILTDEKSQVYDPGEAIELAKQAQQLRDRLRQYREAEQPGPDK